MSQSVILDLVGPDRRVLDVGCATGYIARGLVRQGCVVSGVEMDPEAAEEARDVLDQLVIADLEDVDLVKEFGAHSFDAVVFGDVLEHLRNPAELLRQARELIAPGGSLVVSIPNIAHGDVRLALLDGHWDYRPLGLLDDTHLRFFTHNGVRQLLADTGFAIVDTRRIPMQLFCSEIGVKERDYPPELIKRLRADPEIETYQFVCRAVPDDADGAVAVMAERENALLEERNELRAQIAALSARVSVLEPAAARASDAAAAAAALPGVLAERDAARGRAAALSGADAELRALRKTRTFRYTAAIRGAYSTMLGARR